MLHDDTHGAFGKAVAEKVDYAGRAGGERRLCRWGERQQRGKRARDIVRIRLLFACGKMIAGTEASTIE